LWFHHVSWGHKMKSGRTLWDEICYRYDDGLQKVRQYQKVWDGVLPYVDAERHSAVQTRLRSQMQSVQRWKDGCLLYFQQFSKMPIPTDIERPVHDLQYIIDNFTMNRP
jgi:Alpha-glucuronidase